jgi:hypothetical protein
MTAVPQQRLLLIPTVHMMLAALAAATCQSRDLIACQCMLASQKDVLATYILSNVPQLLTSCCVYVSV